MIEFLLIILQIVFIIFFFNFSIYEIYNKINIKYFDLFETMSVNILFILNFFLFLSILNLKINFIFWPVFILTCFGILKNFENKQIILKNNVNFIIIFIIISFVISIDLATSIDLGWDVKFFGFLKTLNYYQNNNLENLNNLIINDYPHLGNLVWSIFWKFPLNYSEYFGRISFIVIYITSIFAFYGNLKINKASKLIFIFLTISITYEYSLISGLQEILVFSLIVIASKFAYYLILEKNNLNKEKLLIFIILCTNAVCWIKNEGLILMLILNFSLLFTKIDLNLKKKLVIGTFFIILLRTLYFVYFKINLDSSDFENTLYSSNFSFIKIINDIKLISFYIAVYLTEIPIYLITLPLILWIFLTKNNNKMINRFILIFLSLNILFVFVSFAFNETNVEWQVRVALKRVIFESAGFYLLPILQIINKKI